MRCYSAIEPSSLSLACCSVSLCLLAVAPLVSLILEASWFTRTPQLLLDQSLLGQRLVNAVFLRRSTGCFMETEMVKGKKLNQAGPKK